MRAPASALRLILTATTLLVIQGAMAQPAPRSRGPGSGPSPAHMLMERLSRMTPEERQSFLDRLPLERREKVEARLRQLDNMTPEARERLRREYTEFQQLAPEKRQEIRGLFRQFSEASPDRRRELGRELGRLRRLPPDQRAERIASEQFKSEYTEQERDMLEGLANVLPHSEPLPWRDLHSRGAAQAQQHRSGAPTPSN